MIKYGIAVALLLTLITFPLWAWFFGAALIVLYLFVLGMCRAASRRPEFLIERDTISREEWEAHKASSPYFAEAHEAPEVEGFVGPYTYERKPYDWAANEWTPED